MANPIPNLFRVPELKEKILFTLMVLLIYRTGAHVTVPGVDYNALQAAFASLQGTLFGVYDLFVGGGVQGGTVVGKSDRHGAYPHEQPVKPENFAATIYHALGIPASAVWHDAQDRPHRIYHGEPIAGLT